MKTKVLKCCVGCSGLKNGMCCCSLPVSCHEYVDVDIDEYGNYHYTTTTVDLYNKEMYELQNEQLKATLAEKDKQIVKLEPDNQRLFDKYATSEYLDKNKTAIEELNELKNDFYIKYSNKQFEEWGVGISYDSIMQIIDERIKALKGEEK